jgi:hypothetical protein
MDSPRKLLIGYDLCEDLTQISCFSYKTMEPIPLSAQEGEEDYMLPTVLCLKTETKQWLIGEEAISCAAGGSGELVEQFLHKVQSEKEIEVGGQCYPVISLLEKYFRKTLTLVKNYFPTEQITKLVVTLRRTEPILVDKIYEALSLLGVEKDRAVVMSHAGVALYYALSQEKSLWMNDVGLFEFHREGLFFYQIQINRRTKPMIAGLTRKDYSDILNINMLKQKGSNPAYLFENIANNALYKQIITTLYLTGNGFEGEWAQEVIRSLCMGRRVFLGQNLFTKGACYTAKELTEDAALKEFILLTDDMITSCVAVWVYRDTAFRELPLTQAGENWYEVNKSVEVIQEKEAQLEIICKNIMTRETVREIIPLGQFPKRPDRMTRLRINLTCRDKSTGIITITDLGFGDIYPATWQSAEVMIHL